MPEYQDYTGKVIPITNEFEKGPEGYSVGSLEDIHKTLGNDWWHLPAAVAAGGAAVTGLQAAWNWLKDKEKPPIDRTRDIPMGNMPPPAPQEAPKVNLSEKVSQMEQALASRQPVSPPVTGMGEWKPVAPNAPTNLQTPAGPAQVPGQVQPSTVAPAQNPPSLTEAVAIGQNKTTAIQREVAQMIDDTKVEKNISQRIRRTKSEIAAEQAALKASAPPGFHPWYQKKAGEMGPGAYSHLYNTMGQEKAMKYWEEAVGKRNLPYKEFMKNFEEAVGSKMVGPKQPLPEGTKSAVNAKRPTYVPEYIKGGISPAMALNLAGNALGAAGLMQAYKHGKKTGDWSDLGLGSIGQLLANIAPRVAIPYALMQPGTLNANEQQELARRAAMPPTID